MGGRTRQTGPR
ncbi:hypothetical protein BC938DRAFT_474580 [Jimgerdemannia flammicorona]|uniref:Uncharacterized protein n=1 Tax=Jimgerdemannia flammicorona TaxID=994334 RepID=A0A433Q216_9FUNG|nr:hypothetical protein BC938DRAFT_474580 [Jimgerdemannia flammicorona]